MGLESSGRWALSSSPWGPGGRTQSWMRSWPSVRVPNARGGMSGRRCLCGRGVRPSLEVLARQSGPGNPVLFPFWFSPPNPVSPCFQQVAVMPAGQPAPGCVSVASHRWWGRGAGQPSPCFSPRLETQWLYLACRFEFCCAVGDFMTFCVFGVFPSLPVTSVSFNCR